MTPLHHPADDLLVAYAAGNLPEGLSLVIATHTALCPRCRTEVRRLEAVGGALLEQLPAIEVGEDVLARVLAQLDAPSPMMAFQAPEPERAPRAGTPPRKRAAVLPEPLRGYMGSDLDGIPFTRVVRGVEEADVPCGGSSAKVRLLRIKAGTAMPRHTHGGTELTLVMQGGFRDGTGHFVRGDFCSTDGTVDHKPVADEGEDCVCLVATDAPLRLTGPIGRLVNPFIRF